MVVRRRKKKNKLRGNRTHGKGNTKNKRGAGCRGGRGRAGSKKHKKMMFLREERKKRLKPKRKGLALNLDELTKIVEKALAEGIATKEKGFVVIDGKKLGIEKILGRGEIKEKVKILNAKVSSRAKEKIEAAGGIIEVSE